MSRVFTGYRRFRSNSDGNMSESPSPLLSISPFAAGLKRRTGRTPLHSRRSSCASAGAGEPPGSIPELGSVLGPLSGFFAYLDSARKPISFHTRDGDVAQVDAVKAAVEEASSKLELLGILITGPDHKTLAPSLPQSLYPFPVDITLLCGDGEYCCVSEILRLHNQHSKRLDAAICSFRGDPSPAGLVSLRKAFGDVFILRSSLSTLIEQCVNGKLQKAGTVTVVASDPLTGAVSVSMEIGPDKTAPIAIGTTLL